MGDTHTQDPLGVIMFTLTKSTSMRMALFVALVFSSAYALPAEKITGLDGVIGAARSLERGVAQLFNERGLEEGCVYMPTGHERHDLPERYFTDPNEFDRVQKALEAVNIKSEDDLRLYNWGDKPNFRAVWMSLLRNGVNVDSDEEWTEKFVGWMRTPATEQKVATFGYFINTDCRPAALDAQPKKGTKPGKR